MWSSSVFVSDSACVGYPLPFWHVVDHDSQPFDGLVEGGVWIGVSPAYDSKDGGSGLFNLCVNRVVCEVDG